MLLDAAPQRRPRIVPVKGPVETQDLHAGNGNPLESFAAEHLAHGGFLVGHQALALHPGHVVGHQAGHLALDVAVGQKVAHPRCLQHGLAVPFGFR